jgi:hypothetical protein
MAESLRTRFSRFVFNHYPSYWGSGGRLTYIDDSWQEIRLKLPLKWRTRNYMGTIFGGSIYGAVDPIYAMMLIKALGEEYVVWDKNATVTFKRPADRTLYATFEIPDQELADIRESLETEESLDREYTIDLIDDEGAVYATVEKTVHVSTDQGKRA